MAQPTNIISRYDVTGIREDLDNAIFLIDQEDTPLTSSIKRDKCKHTYTEWQVDALRAANKDNAAIEGDDSALSARTTTTRVGNITQIFKDVIGTTGTLEEIDVAGRPNGELARERIKVRREQKRDMEAAFLSVNASVAGTDAAARKLGGLEAWITTNVSSGSGYANGGFSGGIVAAPTDGVQRAFTSALLDTVMETSYTNGAKPSQLYMAPSKKTAFAAFTGIAVNRLNLRGVEEGALVTGVDVYQSNFGKLSVVPSIHVRTRTVMGIDPDYLHLTVLGSRLFKEEKLAKNGDNEKMHILSEITLKVDNQKAHFKIADLT